MINVNGEVVGVAVSFLTGGQSLNFAVPAAVVQKLLAEISADTAPVAFRKKNLGMNAAISAVFFLAIFAGYKFFTRR